jgi:tetratricopeptide (TPR) repeat protein
VKRLPGRRREESIALVSCVALLLTAACGDGASGPPEGTSRTVQLSASGESPFLIYRRAMELYHGEDFNGAAELLMEVVALKPDHLEAHYYAGKSFLKGVPTDYLSCEREFRKVIELDPNHVDARIALAQAFFHWGKYEKAAELQDWVLERMPNHRGALYSSGMIASRMGENEKAVQLLSRALLVDPKHVPSRLELGLALGRVGRHEESIEAYNEVLKVYPKATRALLGVGTALQRLGRVEEAREVLSRFREAQTAEEVANSRDKEIRVWVNQARSAYQEGRFEDARMAEESLLKDYGDDQRALVLLGIMQGRVGQVEAAIETHEKVIGLNPRNMVSRGQLIGLYERVGNTARAREHRELYERSRDLAKAGRRD